MSLCRASEHEPASIILGVIDDPTGFLSARLLKVSKRNAPMRV